MQVQWQALYELLPSAVTLECFSFRTVITSFSYMSGTPLVTCLCKVALVETSCLHFLDAALVLMDSSASHTSLLHLSEWSQGA